MSVFSLIHGAFHGAWCWDLVIPELESRGHRCIAVDLPIDDPEAGLARHRDVVAGSLNGVGTDDDVVVVGHSLGGLVAPLVADARTVSRVVFLNSPIPIPGVSLVEQKQDEPDMVLGALEPHVVVGADGLRRLSPSATETIYRDCPVWVSEVAPEKWRPQNSRGMSDPCPLTVWPRADFSYILSTQDNQVSPQWGRAAARTRLGIEALELPGLHYPMFACPEQLAHSLHESAASS